MLNIFKKTAIAGAMILTAGRRWLNILKTHRGDRRIFRRRWHRRNGPYDHAIH